MACQVFSAFGITAYTLAGISITGISPCSMAPRIYRCRIYRCHPLHKSLQLRKEEGVDEEEFATEERLVLSPLPCWAHLPETEWRQRVVDLIDEIEEEGATARELEEKTPLGVKRILAAKPAHRPKKVVKSPKPRFHARKPEVWKRMWEAWREVVSAFWEASARLLAGERDVEFPEGTFPPHLPFVPFAETLLVEPRGQPA